MANYMFNYVGCKQFKIRKLLDTFVADKYQHRSTSLSTAICTYTSVECSLLRS